MNLFSIYVRTPIVEKIVEKKADYLIGLKDNQGTLNEDVRLFFGKKSNVMKLHNDFNLDKIVHSFFPIIIIV
jgi:hypothetical protein